MGQLITAKQGHERLSKWGDPFVESLQGWFARHCIADQHRDKIDEIIGVKACASEPHLFLDRFQDAGMGEHLSKGCHFPQKGRY
jgi:hypothetical protein